ncbi:MAG: DUF6134 family protein [Pseudomonadota bacterium]
MLDRAALVTTFFALSLSGAALAGETAFPGVPADDELSFKVFRGDAEIGTHVLRFWRDGQRLTVDIDIDLKVKVGPIPVFRYTHEGQEVWDADGFVRMTSTTNDDGEDLTMSAKRTDAGISIEGSNFTGVIDAGPIPTTYWNQATIEQTRLISSQSGLPLDVEIENLGTEQVETDAGSVEATKYVVRSKIDLFLWYDEAGRWVKCAFDGKGKLITYQLQGAAGDITSLAAVD